MKIESVERFTFFRPKKTPGPIPRYLLIILFAVFVCSLPTKASPVTISSKKVQAGDSITISGEIPNGASLNIVIASQRRFSPKKAGNKESSRLIKESSNYEFRRNTSIPQLYYILTSNPSSYGETVTTRFGGAFFFKGLYKTKKFRLKSWKDIKDSLKKRYLGPVETESQWNLVRYAHEEEYGINTITKERERVGKVTIFSRSVLSDYKTNPYYWNKGTSISLDQKHGEFKASFKTFSHTSPNTEFVVYLNGEEIGTFIVKSRGLWLPLGWRYVNPFLVILGAIIAGTVYSTVGAAGGMLMLAAQFIFIGTAGPMGINAANIIKPSNFGIILAAAPAGLYRYWFKDKRLALPAALIFGGGLTVGAFLIGPPLSARYLNLATFKPWLAVLVLIIFIRTLYEMSPWGMEARKEIKKVTEKFEKQRERAKQSGQEREMGTIKSQKWSWKNYKFQFWGEEFELNIPILVSSGFLIGIVDAAFGIGGGFLIVPTLCLLGGLPMYAAVPINLFAGTIEVIAGIGRYTLMGYPPDIFILLFILIGGLIGGVIGSRIQHLFSERQLKAALAMILLFLIFRFAGIEIWI